jgi:hypothetical protein
MRGKGHFRGSCPSMAKPTKGRSKGNALTSVKTWDDSLSEKMNLQGRAATDPHHGHHASALWKEVK